MTTRATRRERSPDDGTSLLELMISVVVMAVIVVAMLTVLSTFFENEAASSQRIGESRDLQQIATFIPGDVSSAYATELVADTVLGDTYVDANNPATAPTCPGYTTPGANVLSLKWSETFGGSIKQFRVNYRTQTVGTETRIVRVSCSGTPLGSPKVSVVAHQLAAGTPVLVTLDGPKVVMVLYEKSGRTLTLTATSQNPHASLEEATDYDL